VGRVEGGRRNSLIGEGVWGGGDETVGLRGWWRRKRRMEGMVMVGGGREGRN